MQRLKAAFNRTRSQRRPDSHPRPGDALEVPCPEVLQFEEIAEKPAGSFGDDDPTRLSDPLQARREVRRLTDNAALLRLPRNSIREVADTTTPVAMPTLTCSGEPAAVTSFGAASTSASPAWTARSASCSWARG